MDTLTLISRMPAKGRAGGVLVFYPDLSTGTDRVSGNEATISGTTYDSGTDSRDFEASTGDLMSYSSPVDMSGVPLTFAANVTLESHTATGYVMEIRESTTNLSVAIAVVASGRVLFRHSCLTTNLLVTSTTALSDGVGAHVAVTYDGSGLASGVGIWIDGALDTPVSTQNGVGATRAVDGEWTIGNRFAASDGLDGVLSDVRTYSRILDAWEIAALAA